MDDDRNRHRRVYAKGYFDGLKATGGAMTPVRQQSILRGMPKVAQKVFEFVPIQEAWADTRIHSALTTATRSVMERRAVAGCLDRLRDAGLVLEVGKHEYRRVRVSAGGDGEPAIGPEPSTPAPVVNELQSEPMSEAKATPIELIAGITHRLSCAIDEIRAITSDLETVALQIELQQAENGREVEKLRQFKALLKDL